MRRWETRVRDRTELYYSSGSWYRHLCYLPEPQIQKLKILGNIVPEQRQSVPLLRRCAETSEATGNCHPTGTLPEPLHLEVMELWVKARPANPRACILSLSLTLLDCSTMTTWRKVELRWMPSSHSVCLTILPWTSFLFKSPFSCHSFHPVSLSRSRLHTSLPREATWVHLLPASC